MHIIVFCMLTLVLIPKKIIQNSHERVKYTEIKISDMICLPALEK